MRRDVYIENDSGGFSVVAGDAVDAIIEDSRANDFGFVERFKAMLLELYGDDSVLVRIVAGEPLNAEEDAQWLARASWQIDSADGQMVVMGGFDPDVLSWWKEGGTDDGRGVASFRGSPGAWKVDLYAHVGSMNGRQVLTEAGVMAGEAFRASHPGRAFPLWLAQMLDFSGEEDPGFEELWKDPKASVDAGKLAVDIEGPDAIGFVVHFTRANDSPGEPPESGWFDRDMNSRVPAAFPVGLHSATPHPGATYFRNRMVGYEPPEPERPIAERVVEVIEVWSGGTVRPVEGGPVSLPLAELYYLHWMAALCGESSPRFELWVEPKGAWTPPSATSDVAVASKGKSKTAIAAVENTGGWHTWWTARTVAGLITNVPDGSTIDLGIAPRHDEHDKADPTIGRALYSGLVKDGIWQISYATPRVSRETLEQALDFVRDLVEHDRIVAPAGPVRAAFEAAHKKAAIVVGKLAWEGDVAQLVDKDERSLLMLASAPFRVRFGGHWPMYVEEPDDDE